MRKLMKSAGRSSTAATSTRRELMRAHRLHLLLHWTLSRRDPRHRRRRLHRQPRGQGAGRRPAGGSSCTTTCRRATAAAVRWGDLVVGDIRDAARCARTMREHGVTRRDALCRVARRSASRCATRPATTGTTSRARWRCCGRWSPSRCGRSSSRRRRAVFGEPERDADHRDASARARSTPTARRSWPSSGRCRTSSGRTACSAVALRYFNAAGADPDGEIGEDHRPEIHLIPLAIEAALRRRAAAGVRRRLPDARRHLPARLHPRDATWPTRTCCALRRLERGRRVGRVQPRQRPSVLGAGRDRGRRAGDRPARAVDAGAAARRAIRRCCSRRAQRIQRRARLAAAIRGSRRASCETAWRWHAAHPHGFARRDGAADGAAAGRAHGSAAVGRDAGLQRAGHDRGDHPRACWRCRVRIELDRRRRLFDRRHARHAGAACRRQLGFQLLLQERNQGKGAALRRGLRRGHRRPGRHPGRRSRVLARGVPGAHRADLRGARRRRLRLAVPGPAPRVPVHALPRATGC